MEEKEIIKQVQSGNVKVFSQLVDSHKNMVYSLIHRMVSNAEDAEEVAQDTFVKVYKSINEFKGESKFSTWLYRIAYYTAINHLRKSKLLISQIDMSSFKDGDTTVIESLNNADQQKYLKEAMEYLKPIERSLISLYYLEELSIKEIQEITGFSLSKIKVQLLRIRKKMYGIMYKILNHEMKTILRK